MNATVASVSFQTEPATQAVPPAAALSQGFASDLRLPVRQLEAQEGRTRCWWLGVHGGAGESSLAHLFAGISAADHHWPIGPERRTRVVLVARTNFIGMTAVQATMRDWSARRRQDVDVLGLVLIADRPGRLPRPLLDIRRDLEGATAHLWRLPWVEAWALGEVPSRENAPRKEVEALRLGLTAALMAARKETHDA